MKLEEITQEWVDKAHAALNRLEVIRDAFLDGRDADAVQIMREGSTTQPTFLTASMILAPGQSSFAVARTQLPFRALRFAVVERPIDSDSRISACDVLSIRVGNNVLGAGAGVTDSEFFAIHVPRYHFVDHGDAEQPGVRIEFPENTRVDRLGIAISAPVALPGMDLTVTAHNRSLFATVRFSALFFGVLEENR